MGFFSKVADTIGSTIFSATGAKAAAAQNNAYQKEFAQNAHQWEVEDLKKAGLNPILSAGGSGASASGGGVSAPSVNPFATAIDAITGITSALKNNAEAENTEMNTLLQKAQTQMTQTNNQIALIDKYIKDKASGDLIAQEKAKLQKMVSENQKTQEEIKQIKAGKAANIVGTDVVDTAKELADKLFGKNEPQAPNKSTNKSKPKNSANNSAVRNSEYQKKREKKAKELDAKKGKNGWYTKEWTTDDGRKAGLLF